MNKLIEVKNIFYKYPADEEDTENKQTDVLRGVSLDVGEGELLPFSDTTVQENPRLQEC